MRTNSSLRTRFDIVFDAIISIIGIIIAIVAIYPMFFALIASFSDPVAVANGKVWLFPHGFTLKGYEKVFEDARVWLGYRNTILYTLGGTFFSLLCTLPAAYALSRKELVFRKGVMMIFIFTMFFNGGLIPTYFVIQKIKMVDTPWVMMIPFAVNVYNVIIARTFFQTTIPEELFEASKIDGCSYTRFFILMVLPLSKAIIAVLCLYYAVGYWNEYFRALIYIRDKSYVPLQLILREILISNMAFTDTASLSKIEEQRLADIMKYSLILISTIPVMCMYPFVQKYFTKGVMIGAVKG